MSENQGPLYIISKVNYLPVLTPENYYSIKQLIDQVISEDQEYVSWNIKDLRTGGTMNTFVPSDIEHYEPLREGYNKETQENKTQYHHNTQINEVPKNMTFIRDIYEAQRDQEVDGMQPLEDLSYEDQFKLLVLNLDEEQNNRFEVFHRTALSKSQVKRLAGVVCSQNVGENVRVFLQAIGKVFAGELIELALEVRKKWFVNFMISQFDKKKNVGHRLKKYLKKLTILVEKASFDKNSSDPNYLTIVEQDKQDGIDENESDEYFDDEEDTMKDIKAGNLLLKSKDNTSEIRVGLIEQYNKLVKIFNDIDVSVEPYINSPILPEHMREAWRLYQLQSDTYIPGQWRGKGEANGDLFR